MKHSAFLRLTAAAAGLTAFGWWYAQYIYKRPARRRTWATVVVGDGVTDLGMMLMLQAVTGSWRYSWVPVVCHLLTGIPMILMQEKKLDEEIKFIVNRNA